MSDSTGDGILRIIVPIAAMLVACGVARADEFTEQLDLARQSYEEGDYVGASEELQFAIQSLQSKIAEQYVATFPEPPEGWTAGGIENQSGPAFMGGGVTIRRTYGNDLGATIEANLIANNPMVQSMAGMIGLMAGQPGAKRVRVGRENAVVTYDAAQRSGEATLAVGRALIRLEGRGLDGPEILETLLKSWDLQKVHELAG
jgi:hypothetical protein